nr:MAG TPA: hypothetical protein [Caudoviricetes sp.]
MESIGDLTGKDLSGRQSGWAFCFLYDVGVGFGLPQFF